MRYSTLSPIMTDNTAAAFQYQIHHKQLNSMPGAAAAAMDQFLGSAAVALPTLGTNDRQASIAFTIDQIISNGEDLGMVMPELVDCQSMQQLQQQQQAHDLEASAAAALTTAQAAAAFAAASGTSGSASARRQTSGECGSSTSNSDAPLPRAVGPSSSEAPMSAPTGMDPQAAALAALFEADGADWLEDVVDDDGAQDFMVAEEEGYRMHAGG